MPHHTHDSSALRGRAVACEIRYARRPVEPEDPPAADTMAAKLAGVTHGGDEPDVSDARRRVAAKLFGGDAKPRARRTIGRFTLLERLGAGAMGEVFAAHDPELDRKVAIKLVHRDRAGSEAARARLLREAQAMARLSHPNVVTVYESGTHGDRVFIAMELIAGVDLRQRFHRERPWRPVVEVYRDAARGLAAAHAVGLVHRDFKPENVMIGEDGRVRVLDFGVARASEGGANARAAEVATLHETASESLATGPTGGDLLARSMTRSGQLLGTPAYMAPEQFASGTSGPKSDQFSFCVALHESLYGRRPFAATNLAELLDAHARPVRPPASSDVPRSVHAIVQRGLSVDPAARFDSMDALAVALHRCLTSRRRLLQRLTLAGATGAALVAGYMVAGEPALTDTCAAGEAAIAAVWNPERAAAIATTFAASGTADAAESWQRMTARVDAYATTWAAGHADACAAATLGGESARRLSELRMACLSDARRELDETLKVLAGAEQAVIFGGVQAIADLPDLRRCADSEALLAAVPAPTDPQVATAVAGLRSRAAEVRALRRAGLSQRGHEAITRLLTAAAKVDYPPLRAELDLLAGQLELDTAHYDAAATTLERAFWAAIDSGHDEVAATAAVTLASLLGARKADLAAGLGWARSGEALIRRNHLSPSHDVTLRRTRARMLRVAGRPDEARRELDEAQAVLERITPEVDDLERSALLRELGSTALDQGRADEAAQLIERALDSARAALGERHPEVARSLRMLGTVLYTSGRREAALQAFEQARHLAELAYGPDHTEVGDALNNIGAVLDELGRDVEAVPAYERALAIRRNNLGADHPDVAATLDNLAFTLTELGRLDEAEAAMLRSQQILKEVHGARHSAIATNLLGLASLHRARREFDRAVVLTEEAAQMLRDTLGPDHPDLGYALAQLAEIQLMAGEPAKAVEPARRALALRGGPNADPLLVAEAQLRLGQGLWLTQRDRSEALGLLRSARSTYAALAPAATLAGIDTWLKEQRVKLSD